jgi:hypothetical protein
VRSLIYKTDTRSPEPVGVGTAQTAEQRISYSYFPCGRVQYTSQQMQQRGFAASRPARYQQRFACTAVQIRERE